MCQHICSASFQRMPKRSGNLPLSVTGAFGMTNTRLITLVGLIVGCVTTGPLPAIAEPMRASSAREETRRIRSSACVLDTDLDTPLAQECVRQLERLQTQWTRFWGDQPGQEHLLRVSIFSYGADYRGAAADAGIPGDLVRGTRGLFVARSQRILVNARIGDVRARIARLPHAKSRPLPHWQATQLQRWTDIESREWKRVFRTLRHEAVHAYLYADGKRSGLPGPYPAWLQEGMAEYFEATAAPQRRGCAPGVHRAHGPRLRSLLDLGELLSLSDLLNSPREQSPAQRFPRAHAWGLVHFLRASNLDRDATGWRQFAGLDGEQQMRTLEIALGQPRATLERSWRRHIRDLTS